MVALPRRLKRNCQSLSQGLSVLNGVGGMQRATTRVAPTPRMFCLVGAALVVAQREVPKALVYRMDA